jgi:hypothetical protein
MHRYIPVLAKNAGFGKIEKKWCNTKPGNMEKLNLGWNVSLMDSWI